MRDRLDQQEQILAWLNMPHREHIGVGQIPALAYVDRRAFRRPEAIDVNSIIHGGNAGFGPDGEDLVSNSLRDGDDMTGPAQRVAEHEMGHQPAGPSLSAPDQAQVVKREQGRAGRREQRETEAFEQIEMILADRAAPIAEACKEPLDPSGAGNWRAPCLDIGGVCETIERPDGRAARRSETGSRGCCE